MPEIQITNPNLTYDPDHRFILKRASFRDAAQDSYTIPPAQNPDWFEQLYNTLPGSVQGVLQRRWGYQLWSSDSTVIRRLYEFHQQNNALRRILGTTADGTGASSATNKVNAYNEDGTVFLSPIFTPSSGASSPRAMSSRDFAYFADGLQADLLKWNGVFLNTYTLSAVANASSGSTVYTGTGLGSIANGTTLVIAGFLTAANNGRFVSSASSSTTVTVNNATGVAETHAGTAASQGLSIWGITAPTNAPTIGVPTGGASLSFSLSAVANAAGGNTVYTGTGLAGLTAGTLGTVSGFVTGANNGTFTVVSSTSTTVTLNNPSGVAETNPGQLTTASKFLPTTNLNGWGPSAHLSLFNDTLSLNPNPTNAYTNPGNAIDNNETTFASAVGEGTNLNPSGCVWSFSALTSSITNASLNILSELPVSGTDGFQVGGGESAIYYSLDAGNSWKQVYFSTAPRAKQYDVIPLPTSQDYSKVQVMALMYPHNHMYHKVYEINIQASNVGTGPVTLTKGRNYYYVYGNSSSGGFSDLSPVSVSTGPVAGGAFPLTLVNSSDPQVDLKVVLATADGGNTGTLYFVGQLDNITTTFVDGTPELTLLAGNVYNFVDAAGDNFGLKFNTPPPNGLFPTKHRGRVYLLQGENLFFSKNIAEITTPTGVIAGRYEEAWPASNQMDVSNGAEVGRCLLSDGDFLYIGTDRHVLRLIGDGPTNFQPPQTAFNEGGVLNQDSWRSVYLDGQPIGCMWITPDFRVIQSDFNTHMDVGTPIQDVLNNINTAATANVYAQYFAFGAYNFYVLAIPTGSNTDADTLCVYDLRQRRWLIWFPTDKITSLLYNINASGIPQMILWSSAAIASRGYKFVPGLVQDRVGNTPVSFTCTARTSWQDFGDGTLRKVLNWCQVTSDDSNITLAIDGASSASAFSAPRTVISATAFQLSPFGDLSIFLAGRTTKDRYYRFTFQSTGTNLGFLRGFNVRGFGWHTF